MKDQSIVTKGMAVLAANPDLPQRQQRIQNRMVTNLFLSKQTNKNSKKRRTILNPLLQEQQEICTNGDRINNTAGKTELFFIRLNQCSTQDKDSSRKHYFVCFF